MGKEIERKFVVNQHKWDQVKKDNSYMITQSYIAIDETKSVRIRVTKDQAFITVKGVGRKLSRLEYEYPIPREDAMEMLANFNGYKVVKERFEIIHSGKLWEVDVFSGENEGLIIAEIEIKDEKEEIVVPKWVTKDVTGNKIYYNDYISRVPYKVWKHRPEVSDDGMDAILDNLKYKK